ncbi:MAG: HNH endonuclease [Prevotellaceae bacterium]|jgi:hypothetical protein|nr:HNH endonuclease [Prevotellaceae bacterium]
MKKDKNYGCAVSVILFIIALILFKVEQNGFGYVLIALTIIAGIAGTGRIDRGSQVAESPLLTKSDLAKKYGLPKDEITGSYDWSKLKWEDFITWFRWEDRDNRLYLTFDPPANAVLTKYDYHYSHYDEIPYDIDLYVEDKIDCCSFSVNFGYRYSEKFVSPKPGIFINLKKGGDDYLTKGESPFCICYDIDFVNEYIESKEIERKRLEVIALEQKKLEIKYKILKKQLTRQLEKEVTQELIDSGILFGEQTRRPSIPREVVDAVYSRDCGKCVYCGSTENLQLDHIIPFSKGGATNIENLQLLCQKCNLEKSNKIG